MTQRQIVVGLDGSNGAKAALAWACEDARREPGAKIVAVSAWVPAVPATSPWFVGYDLPLDRTEATAAELKASVAAVVSDRFADIEVEERVVCGSASGVLLSQGGAADLLVVGSRGLGGFKGLLLGSVSHQIVTHAPCPTVIVPHLEGRQEAANADLSSIVVGVDGSDNSIAALRWAAERARACDGVVHAVYVWQAPATAVAPIGAAMPLPAHFADAATEALSGFIAEAALPSDVHVEPAGCVGSPVEVLLAKGRQADLLVVGARGHGGFVGLLLGSVTTAVAHHAPCPVAVIPDR